MTKARDLRTLLSQDGIVRAPGVWDGMTARLSEQGKFPAVYMTGAGTSMARGYPDFGLLAQTRYISSGLDLLSLRCYLPGHQRSRAGAACSDAQTAQPQERDAASAVVGVPCRASQ